LSRLQSGLHSRENGALISDSLHPSELEVVIIVNGPGVGEAVGVVVVVEATDVEATTTTTATATATTTQKTGAPTITAQPVLLVGPVLKEAVALSLLKLTNAHNATDTVAVAVVVIGILGS